MNRRKIYITGGSSGIGLGLARRYARRGCDVVLIARDVAKLDSAMSSCNALRKSEDQEVEGVSVDITDYENLHGSLKQIFARCGVPDLIILSAGTAANASFLDTTAAAFDHVMNVNLVASREVARAALPAMIERGSGQIAFVSSMAGCTGIYGYSAYSASKFAINGMAQALSQELLATGVSVHVICPSEVSTPMIEQESRSVLPQTRFLKDLVGTMEPDVVAAKIERGLSRGQRTIVPGFRASLMTSLARSFPDVFAWCSARLLHWKFG
jgi:short-subunit dehydrogenase